LAWPPPSQRSLQKKKKKYKQKIKKKKRKEKERKKRNIGHKISCDKHDTKVSIEEEKC
jgi:hypothetical protein